MIVGVFWLLTANAASLLGAWALLRRVQTGRTSTDLVLFLLLRLFLISGAVMAAGLIGGLERNGLGIVSLMAIAALLRFGVHKSIPPPARPAWGRIGGAVAAIVVVRLLLQVWFFSPHLGDATAYHLPKIAEWIQHRGFTREMGLHPHVTFPAGFELVETWWVVFLRHDVLIELAGVEFLVLAFAATYGLADRLGLSDRSSFFAALSTILVPGLNLTTTSCMNDGPAAALVIATVALVVLQAPIPCILMTMGLGLGVKPTYGFALTGIALLWGMSRKDSPASPSPSRIVAWSLAAGGMGIGVYWYLRNLVWFGNPFHPLGTSEIDNPVAVQFGPRVSSLWTNLADLVNVRIYDQGYLGANIDDIAGWGPLAFACGLPALVIALRSGPLFRRLTGCLLVSLGTSLLFSRSDPWHLKYVLYFPVLLTLAAAWFAERNLVFARISWAALGCCFVATLLPYDLPWKDFKGLARQSWSERSALSLLKASVEEKKVGCFGGFTAHAYLLYGPDFSREVVYLRVSSAADLVSEARTSDLRQIYASPSSSLQNAVLREAVLSGRLRQTSPSIYRLSD
ncbi:MAG TPA: hypothetical protein VN898_06725 [Candidatus Binatia bacterium]|nr:hypothetical protein [Candidatus Binatia bacterium]